MIIFSLVNTFPAVLSRIKIFKNHRYIFFNSRHIHDRRDILKTLYLYLYLKLKFLQLKVLCKYRVEKVTDKERQDSVSLLILVYLRLRLKEQSIHTTVLIILLRL